MFSSCKLFMCVFFHVCRLRIKLRFIIARTGRSNPLGMTVVFMLSETLQLADYDDAECKECTCQSPRDFNLSNPASRSTTQMLFTHTNFKIALHLIFGEENTHIEISRSTRVKKKRNSVFKGKHTSGVNLFCKLLTYEHACENIRLKRRLFIVLRVLRTPRFHFQLKGCMVSVNIQGV